MSFYIIIALIISGLLVGFINTLAGGGTIISLSLFMFLGLPPMVANGTNRIPVLFQVMTSSWGFYQKKVLDVRKSLILGIPMTLGSLLGTWLAIDINQKLFEKILAIAMIIMVFFIFYKPDQWIKGNALRLDRPVSPLLYIVFFLVGIYGGFIYVGVGYYMLAAIVIGAGYDLIRANAIKVFLVLLYVPFTLVIFALNHQVNYKYGLIHAIGNIAGAWLATKYAVNWGVNFVKWVLVVFVMITILQSFGIIDVKQLIFNALAHAGFPL